MGNFCGCGNRKLQGTEALRQSKGTYIPPQAGKPQILTAAQQESIRQGETTWHRADGGNLSPCKSPQNFQFSKMRGEGSSKKKKDSPDDSDQDTNDEEEYIQSERRRVRSETEDSNERRPHSPRKNKNKHRYGRRNYRASSGKRR